METEKFCDCSLCLSETGAPNVPVNILFVEDETAADYVHAVADFQATQRTHANLLILATMRLD